MHTNRRGFLALGGTLAAGSALGLPGSRARAAETLTGVTYLPPSYKALSFGSSGFVEYLKNNHAKTVSVDFYDSGRLLKADEQLPALRSGTIDFMFHTTSYITRSLPILGITGLPGVVEELYEHPERLAIGSPLFDLVNQELAKNDLVMLTAGGGLLEPEYVWSTEAAPIASLDDIAGKRIRAVSFEATKVIEQLGGAPTRIPSSELYLALQRGTVDAAVANISTIIGRSIQEQIAQVYRIPITGFGIAVFVEKRRWATMAPAVKEAMQDAARWFDERSAATANDVIYQDEYWPLVEKMGIEIIEPDKAAIDRLASISEGVRAAWVEEVGSEVGARAIALATGKAS